MFMLNDPRRDFLTFRLQYDLFGSMHHFFLASLSQSLPFPTLSSCTLLSDPCGSHWVPLELGIEFLLQGSKNQASAIRWFRLDVCLLGKPGGQVNYCLLTVVPVKWSWQWGKPHIKATLSDVLVTWFAVRIRPCRAQTWANTFRMETWKQEWNKSGCPGHQDCGGIKFPSLCFMP